MRARNPWCSVKRPSNASVRLRIFARSRRLASAAGFCSPWISACSIARPETPVMSEETADSLIPPFWEELLQPLHGNARG